MDLFQLLSPAHMCKINKALGSGVQKCHLKAAGMALGWDWGHPVQEGYQQELGEGAAIKEMRHLHVLGSSSSAGSTCQVPLSDP